jgi:WXG100 family type VII secretion target
VTQARHERRKRVELDGLKVVHGGLDRTADDLMAIAVRIEARLHRLDHELAPLRGGWIGDAQQAYAEEKCRWDGAISEMRDLLRQTSHQVAQANACYREADARAARTFDL